MKLVILDRDGVINYDSPHFIKSPQEWQPIPGSLEAIAQLNQAGYSVAIASNQSGLGRGLFDESTLTAIHHKLQTALARLGGHIDFIAYCPHLPDTGCECRKPNPGLLQQIATHFKIDLKGIPFVGDSLKDLQAAENAGCNGILVMTGNGENTWMKNPSLSHPRYSDLKDFVTDLLQGQ